MEQDRQPDDVEQIDTEDPVADETTPDDLDKTLADSFPASDPPAQP